MERSSLFEGVRQLIERTPPFDDLPPAARAELLHDVRVEYFEQGAVIVEQGAGTHRGLFVVESGMVRLMDTLAQRLIAKRGPGKTFGSFGLLKGGQAIYEAKAVEPTVCAVLSPQRFGDLMDAYPAFAAYFEHDVRRFIRRLNSYVDVGGAHLLHDRPLAELPLMAPPTCYADDPAQQAARLMSAHRTAHVLVLHSRGVAGLVTDESLRARLVAQARPADTPVRRLLDRTAPALDASASLFDAIQAMAIGRSRHLVVTRSANGKTAPVAVLTDRDVAHFSGKDPLATLARIDAAATADALAPLQPEANEQLQSLYQQGVPPEQLARLAATLHDRLTVRAIELAADEMHGRVPKPDVAWAWLRLGSGGRQEPMLSSDQHHAIVYANPGSDEEAEGAEAYVRRLATRTEEILASVGMPAAEVSASDERYCRPLRAWKQRYRAWIFEGDADALLEAGRFFDLRHLYGDAALADALKADIEDALNVQAMDADRRFLSVLAGQAHRRGVARQLLQRIRDLNPIEETVNFDLRGRGVIPVVEAARVLALDLRYLDTTNTFDRLRHATKHLPELRATLEGALDAYTQLVDIRLERQLNVAEAGDQLENTVRGVDLTKAQRGLLRSAFRAVVDLQEALAERYPIG